MSNSPDPSLKRVGQGDGHEDDKVDLLLRIEPKKEFIISKILIFN